MILGTGIDIIEVERIRASHEKFGKRFTRRILLAAEIEYCLRHKDPAPFLAARFAAKEAISKAFGTGICAKLGWHDIEVAKHASGEPYVELHGNGLASPCTDHQNELDCAASNCALLDALGVMVEFLLA